MRPLLRHEKTKKENGTACCTTACSRLDFQRQKKRTMLCISQGPNMKKEGLAAPRTRTEQLAAQPFVQPRRSREKKPISCATKRKFHASSSPHRGVVPAIAKNYKKREREGPTLERTSAKTNPTKCSP